jgi:hypothetical protein
MTAVNSVPNQVIVEDLVIDVNVDEEVPSLVTITATPRAIIRRHIHTQGSASSVWTINHTLGGYPSVMVVDSGKSVVVGDISYVSNEQIVVNFSSAFSGYAYLT